MSVVKEFTKGFWQELPPFRLVLGLCPTLAVTTMAENGLGMGLATTFVLVFSNLLVSILRKLIPGKVRIASYIVVIASFVVMAELLLQAYWYPMYKALGIFVPLIVVNCIILGRAEAFASKNPIILSLGKLFGTAVMWSSFEPLSFMVKAPGAFVCLGFLLGLMNIISRRRPAH
jgi:electron transport complex protein RnfE